MGAEVWSDGVGRFGSGSGKSPAGQGVADRRAARRTGS